MKGRAAAAAITAAAGRCALVCKGNSGREERAAATAADRKARATSMVKAGERRSKAELTWGEARKEGREGGRGEKGKETKVVAPDSASSIVPPPLKESAENAFGAWAVSSGAPCAAGCFEGALGWKCWGGVLHFQPRMSREAQVTKAGG